MAHFPPEDYFAETDDVWTSITCPTLVFWAGRSFTIDPVADGRCALIADCRAVVYPDAGHWLHHEIFAQFITELRHFVGTPAAATREARQA